MQVLFAVIDDLYVFTLRAAVSPIRAFSILYGIASSDRADSTVGAKEYSGDIQADNEELRDEPVFDVEEISPELSFRSIEDVMARHSTLPEAGQELKNTVMYAGGNEISMYKNPTQEFDSVIGSLSYGDMVMVLAQKGRWANVVHGEQNGWVLRDDLVDRAAYVYPKFVIGEQNIPDDPNTIRVRAIISDMFGGGRGEMPLQAGEYVAYRLLRKGLHISWPNVRPRTPGLWHTILKGVTGIHMGVAPKTGAVMEYILTENMGHVAYVEAVFPDETINISEVNFPEDGIYNERVLTQEEWKELKPVFIQVL